jgi:K+-transporting ATPase KdpF subunit
MGSVPWVTENLGLTVLTVVSIALTIYLAYSMVHPERF